MKNKRIMCLDVGEKRIGVAISDPLQKIAQPLAVITRRDIRSDLKSIQELAVKNDVSTLIVGLPLTLKSREGPQAQKVLQFCESLKQLGLEVVMWDERMTTKIAENMLVGAGIKRRSRREVLDKIAAVLILQSYLDNLDEELGDEGCS